jgi:ligand-binding sensor domain-containing protein
MRGRPFPPTIFILAVALVASCSPANTAPQGIGTLDSTQQSFLTVMASSPLPSNTPPPTNMPTGTHTPDWTATATTPPPPTLTPANLKEGLRVFGSPNFINDIAIEDDNKTVWAATTGGVLRWHSFSGEYDRFTVEDGLPADEIVGVYLTADGNVWARTVDRGLAVYDGNAWGWANEANGLPDNSVKNMIVTPEGKLWISISSKSGELFQYEDGYWIPMPIPVSDIRRLLYNPDGKIVLDPRTSRTAYVYSEGDWEEYPEFPREADEMVRTPDGVLWFIDHNRLFSVTNGKEKMYYCLHAGETGCKINSIAADPDGNLWVGHEDGLSVLSHDIWLYYGDPGALTGSLASVQKVRSLPNGEVWIGTSFGLTIWGTAGRYVYQTPREPMINSVTAIGEGPAGTIWVGEESSYVYTYSDQVWEKPFEDFEGCSTVRDIATLGDGSIWFSCPFEMRRLLGDTFTYFEHGTDIPVSGYRLARGKDGSLWACGDTGIAKYQNSKWTKIPIEGLEENEWIRSIAVDRTGNPWAGTNQGHIFHREGGTWRKFDEKDGLVHKTSSSESGLGVIGTLMIDSKNTVWAGTGKGIYLYQDGSWVQKEELLMSVNDIAEGSNGRFYIATAISGVIILQNDVIVDQIRKTDGLPTDSARRIFIASDGTVWIGTSKGIVEYADSTS